jgi:hypothetical protein
LTHTAKTKKPLHGNNPVDGFFAFKGSSQLHTSPTYDNDPAQAESAKTEATAFFHPAIYWSGSDPIFIRTEPYGFYKHLVELRKINQVLFPQFRANAVVFTLLSKTYIISSVQSTPFLQSRHTIFKKIRLEIHELNM